MTPERHEKLIRVLSKRQSDLTVVLENVFDPHNISAVMRTCDAVGVQEIFILNTRIPRHKKFGARSSSSAAKWLSVHQFDNAEVCFKAVRSRYTSVLTTHLGESSVGLFQLDLTKPTALVFGNEHSGVSDEIRTLADGNFLIPQVGIIQSLNISVACAVTLYEAFRQKSAAGQYNRADLETDFKKQIWSVWSGTEETEP